MDYAILCVPSRLWRIDLVVKWQVLLLMIYINIYVVYSQARYSIPEEMPEGSFVGNIAKDLGLDIGRLTSGKARIVTKGSRQYVDLDRDKGILVVKERINREELCRHITPCSFSFEIITENPIQLYRVTVEVRDINDNAPLFPKDRVDLEISEIAVLETRFGLDSAVDLDVGINGIQNYALRPSDHFKLEIQSQTDGRKYVEMILQKHLDREKEESLTLMLIASDGGEPQKSGTVRIHITVLDVNDNAPICEQAVYKAEVQENYPAGTQITVVRASDADQGSNGELTYYFAHASVEATELFRIHPETGEITLQGNLDYETETNYQLNVKAKDLGGLADTCKVVLEIIDVNDNSPSIQLMSFSNTIPANSPPGTTIAVINADDTDSGNNGIVHCAINTDIPFTIESSLSDYYTLVTNGPLDRETTAEYNITILASDEGVPKRYSNKTVTVKILDVNDNPPLFDRNELSAFISENNNPGLSILTIKATDLDAGPNARLTYFLSDKDIGGMPASSLVSVNPDSGVIQALRILDYISL